MEKETYVRREINNPVNGKTDYDRLKSMTIGEKEENARNDPDAQPVSEGDQKNSNV